METNTQVNTYLSAKWNIEVCRSGESGIESSFPFGKEMKPNRILDLWLESMVELMSPGNSKTAIVGGGLLFSKLTDGYIQLGTGTKPITNKDTQLHKYYKKTNYIRSNFDRASGTYISGSGMAIFSRTYDLPIETERVTYTEAGFEPYASALANSPSRRGIWSRFIFTSESPATGFLSGYIDDSGNFNLNKNEIDIGSGIIVSGKTLYSIPPIKTKEYEIVYGYRSGSLDQFNNFSFYSPSNLEYKHAYLSGYIISGKQIPLIDRKIVSQPITGYISGYRDNVGNFSGFKPDLLYSSSGYYLNNQQYKFPPDVFVGFSGENANEFDSYLGFGYSGFNYVTGSGFSGIDNTSSGTGILTGILGYRNLYQNIPLSGFSGLPEFDSYLGFEFSGFNFANYNVQTINGNIGFGFASGIVGNRYVLKVSGAAEEGFDNIPSYEYGWRYNPNGVMFNPQYGSGFVYNSKLQTQNVVGFRSGSVNAFGGFTPYTVPIPGSQGFSGYILSGKKYYFPTGSGFAGFTGMPGFYTGLGFSFSGFFPSQSGFSGEDWPQISYEKINGFISGFRDDLGQFYTFQDLYPELPELKSSGYFLNGTQYYFPTGNGFSGFYGMPGFSSETGFVYTGFSFPEGSLFSGLTGSVGTGISTGFIGHRIFYTYPINNTIGSFTGFIGSRNDFIINSNSGIMTGIFGIRKELSGIQLTTGEFFKVRYDTAIRIPAMIDPIPVTGEDVFYGEFNGSGSIKLVGNYERIFGTISSDGVAGQPSSYVGPQHGFWWPAHNKWTGPQNTTYPNTYLSAVMLGREYYLDYPPPFPPENNTIPMFVIPNGDEFTDVDIQAIYSNGLPYYGRRYRINLANVPYPSWPTYEYGGLTTDYPSNSYPNHINYTMQFRAEFPNQETGLAGFLFGPMEKRLSQRVWHPTKPFVFEDFLSYFIQGINVPYVGWYYRFDNYQTKFEDQLITLNMTLSINRETYV